VPAENVLIAHASQTDMPVTAACRPAEHAEHAKELSAAEKNPAPHAVQVARSADTCDPAGHAPHTASVAFASSGWRNVPSAHATHLVDHDAGSANVPVGHETQLVAPDCGAMAVTEHASHADALLEN
jgi:hypothetical protein